MAVNVINLAAADVGAIRAGTLTQERRCGSIRFDASKPGDMLWVREPFAFERLYDCRAPSVVLKRQKIWHGDLPLVHYCADGPTPSLFGQTRFAREMPRQISRMVLRVVRVRRDHLHIWTDTDASAHNLTRMAYAAKWDELRDPSRAFSGKVLANRWIDNPIVTMVDFEPVFGNIDRILENEPAPSHARDGLKRTTPVLEAGAAHAASGAGRRGVSDTDQKSPSPIPEGARHG